MQGVVWLHVFLPIFLMFYRTYPSTQRFVSLHNTSIILENVIPWPRKSVPRATRASTTWTPRWHWEGTATIKVALGVQHATGTCQSRTFRRREIDYCARRTSRRNLQREAVCMLVMTSSNTPIQDRAVPVQFLYQPLNH